jgi:tryptophan synthase alpha chain
MKAMSRLEKLFAYHKAFIGYLTAGDGGIQRTLDAALALIEGGVNMLEIGIPFSDPIADGPVIQQAAARALRAGTTLQDVLWLIKEMRKRSDIPLILFSYYNPILSAMQTGFLQDAKKAGIDGLLLVDCPLEESQIVHQQCMQNEIALIYIITPSTPLERIQKISHYGQGFLYYACRKGTTGMRQALPDDFEQKIKTIQSLVHLPIVVGFGISNKEMVNKVLQFADGVVVGSLFVKALEERGSVCALSMLAAQLCPESAIAI